MAFDTYNPSSDSLQSLVNSFFAGTSGAALVNGSVSTKFGIPPGETSPISFYDGALSALGMGPGLLLTTGDPTPPESNTQADPDNRHSIEISDVRDFSEAALEDIAEFAYDGDPEFGLDGLYDVAWLQFQVNITDPTLRGINMSLLFGSEEYIGAHEFAGDFPDIAAVIVNGENYAVRNGNDLFPIGVFERNLGSFIDNQAGALPIEYDGVMPRMELTAPVNLGVNTIRIAIADTGFQSYDSGLFVSGMEAVGYTAFGLGILPHVNVTGTGTVTDLAGNQLYLGNSADNSVLLTAGRDVVDGAFGLDEVIYDFAPGATTSLQWDGRTLRLDSGADQSELVNVERYWMAGDNYFALDTGSGGATWMAAALLQAAVNGPVGTNVLSQWVAATDARFAAGGNLGDVGQEIINYYAPTVSNETLIAHLYTNIAGFAPSQQTVAELAAQVGAGKAFETMGDLYAAGALLDYNTNEIGLTGQVVQLDASYFD